MVQKIIDQYCRLLSVLMVIALALMVVLVFGNVVLRYAFNSGFTISEELSRWLFVWMTFLGAVTALNEGSHLGVDSFVARLPVQGKKICLLLGHGLMLFACWLLFDGSWQQVKINLTSTSAVMEASMAIFYASGMAMAASGSVILLNKLWKLFTGQLAEHELIGIRESEEEPIDTPKPLQ